MSVQPCRSASRALLPLRGGEACLYRQLPLCRLPAPPRTKRPVRGAAAGGPAAPQAVGEACEGMLVPAALRP